MIKEEGINCSEIFEEIMKEKTLSTAQLTGGVTNSSCSIVSESGHYILRIPGNGTNEYINRINEIENMKATSVLGLIPEIVYSNTSTGVIISKFIEDNTTMTVEDVTNPEKLGHMMRVLVQLHKSDITFVNEFDILKVQNDYKEVLSGMKVQIPEELLQCIPILDKQVTRLFHQYPKKLVPCHGDPKLNNFLLQSDKMWMIDWEYSGMADKYFDLVNFAMTNNLSKQNEMLFLQAYEQEDGEPIIGKKYILWKIATDYLWIYWHLIKLFQGEMVEYNSFSWKNRLNRAMENIKYLEEKQ